MVGISEFLNSIKVSEGGSLLVSEADKYCVFVGGLGGNVLEL
jgi:hypothetical protein